MPLTQRSNSRPPGEQVDTLQAGGIAESPLSRSDDFSLPARAYRPVSAAAGGCLFSLVVGLITAVLLFFNGGLVLGLLTRFSGDLPDWMREPHVLQFLLFCLPLLLVVVQWMLWDAIRFLLRR